MSVGGRDGVLLIEVLQELVLGLLLFPIFIHDQGSEFDPNLQEITNPEGLEL